MPRDKDAKRFYRAAGQRLEDAKVLFDAERALATIYLAGYCVECMLKALILTQAGKDKKEEVLGSFRGSGAHNIDRLMAMYENYGGPRPSKKDKELTGAFLLAGSWDTNLRYESGTKPLKDATKFLDAVERVWTWADGRL